MYAPGPCDVAKVSFFKDEPFSNFHVMTRPRIIYNEFDVIIKNITTSMDPEHWYVTSIVYFLAYHIFVPRTHNGQHDQRRREIFYLRAEKLE